MTTLFSAETITNARERAECGAPMPRVEDITQKVARLPAFAGHETVYEITEPTTGLHAFIAIHDSTLGPALGGCRMWPYATGEDALTDVLRLSEGMTYKAAMAGMDVGGGKAVIVGDPAADKSEMFFRALGKALNTLDGRYYTGEDVGISVRDVDWMKLETSFVVGGSTGGGGDPSPMTAYGVHVGVRAAVRHRLRRNGLDGLTVAIQGLGKVGRALAERLHEEGARLVVADIDKDATRWATETLGAKVVSTDDIIKAEADVFAPCALGAVLDDESIKTMKAVVVAGSANNQLLEERHGETLRNYGILYAPDYVINGGGLIAVAMEIAPGGYDADKVKCKTGSIGDTLAEIFARADEEKVSTNKVAHRIAGERIARRRDVHKKAGVAS